ncbi:unnamed protein product [Camellia sinensis]
MNKFQLSLLLVVAICNLMTGRTSAMYHIVGAKLGWNIPPNKTYYQDWAKSRVFSVEDKLLFAFRSPLHNVVEVGKDDFDECKQENLIYTYSSGPLIVNFTMPGDHYYYSGVGIQCELGQKLHVPVVSRKGSSGRNSKTL